jgi:hypothetical protein
MSELERDLRALGSELAYPPTPELTQAVRERLPAATVPVRRLPARRTLAIALAALLVAAGGAFAASPRIRHSVLDWLGLRSVRIERVPKLPELPPGRAGRDLGLGRRTTVAAARRQVSFRVLVPAPPPDEVYVSGSPPGGRVVFAYRPRRGLPRAPGTHAGLLITEFRGRQTTTLIQKTLGPGTTAEPVSVGGERGVWISGRPHQFAYEDSQGAAHAETLRLAGNTLLWQRGGVLLRLEANVSKAAALRIARTLR